MSKAKNGNGRIAKYNRLVADKAGLKRGEVLPYSPDFWDSIVRRMAIPVPGEIAERCLAWLIYRANGNQSLKAVHLYSAKGEPPIETELRQHDCALELAWVEAGHRVEWLDAPLTVFHEEAQCRGVKAIDKSRVSNGFQFNRLRGTMEDETGHALVYVPSPNAENFLPIQEICRRKGETPQQSKQFEKWAQVAYIQEFQQWQVAHAEEKRLRNFLLTAYKKSIRLAASETNGTPSLEALEPLESLEARAPAPPPVPVPIYKEPSPSVGRSSSPEPTHTPTDRPTAVPESKFKPKIREWLESHVTIPGYNLEEPQLNEIAATIHSKEHLKQFQEAAKLQKNPRGWKVFVKIARACEKKHGQYEKAMAAGATATPEESYAERRAREIAEGLT